MAGTQRPAILVDELTKHFGRTPALTGTSFAVEEGGIHGFLGPNGAGKSTCIRILLGLLRQGSGTVRVLGRNPHADAVALHRRLAYVPGDVALWPNLTGGETIDVLSRGRDVDRDRVGELCERFELDPTKQGRTYSKGNRQKVAIVAALAADVELLLLDEPTSGLDPLMEGTFQDEIRRANERGTTVLLSSHILAQVEALCDRVSIIRHGRIVEDGTLIELRHLTRTTVHAETSDRVDGLADVDGVHDLRLDGQHLRFAVDTEHLHDAIGAVHRHGLVSLTCHPPTLEQLFMRHYDVTAPDEREDGRRADADR
jgi:ABC-2 type transport system ATP-binding protein